MTSVRNLGYSRYQSAGAKATVDRSIASNVLTVVTLDTQAFASDTGMSSFPGPTLPTAGLYYVFVVIAFTGSTVGQRIVHIEINNVSEHTAFKPAETVDSTTIVHVGGLVNAAAGDILRVTASQSSGISLTFTANYAGPEGPIIAAARGAT